MKMMKKHAVWLGVFGMALPLVAVVVSEAADTAPAGIQPAGRSRPAIETGLTQHAFTAKINKTVSGNYLLYLPEFYGKMDGKFDSKSPQRLPLILFLHGSGERGRNPNILRKFGPTRVALEQKGFPFIVLAPQCPPGRWWTDVDVTEMVMALLDQVSKNYLVDPDRVYLTGMSMGGFGAWHLAQQYPKRWSAMAVVCGGGNPYLQRRVKRIPTRVFHGARDRNVPVGMAQQMAGTLKKAGGQVELKIYPKLAHNVWTVTYDDPQLYQWFLLHSKRNPPKPIRRSTPSTKRSP